MSISLERIDFRKVFQVYGEINETTSNSLNGHEVYKKSIEKDGLV